MAISDREFEFMKKMISIKSVGGDPAPGCPYGENSRKALAAFTSHAEELGFKTGIVEDKAAYVEFGEGDRMIGIVCHLDVVPQGSGWNTDPFELTVKDGVMYGRGIVDDKGPALASFFAMNRLKDSGYVPKSRVRLILGSDEERSCDCIETYASNAEIPEFAVTPDAEFPVIFAEKGILHVSISGASTGKINAKAGNAANMVPNEACLEYGNSRYEGNGKTAHASKPELGVNAILDMITKLDDEVYDASPLLSYIRDCIAGKSYADYTGCDILDFSGEITANPAMLYIDDDHETLIIDIRYPITAKLEDIMDHFTKSAESYGLTVEVASHMAGIHKSTDTDEIRTITKIWSENMELFDGYKPEYKAQFTKPVAVGGGTYARHMPNTVAFGVQTPWMEDQCHQANEHMSVNDFEALIKVMSETITALS